MILAFKLITAPVLIYCLTMLSRRFGPAIGGLLMGVPLLTGPISFFTGMENGYEFAQHAAVANFVGQISTCHFCFCYAAAAKRMNCWASMVASVLAFFVATFIWSQFTWSFVPALGLLLVTIVLMIFLMKPVNMDAIARITPRFDLAARMVISTAFVVLITILTRLLGPQLSGLVAPFPVFVLILSVFTHYQTGAAAASNLLRGVVVGSFSFAAFFTVVATSLTTFGPIITYGVATLASLLVSAIVYLVTHRVPCARLP